MSSSNRRGFYYQAHANAFGGRLDQPFEQLLPVLAPVSLPSAGGYASARHERFRAAEILSIENAYTQVAGSISIHGTFTTLATSVIEGLNVNNILFADRIAAQISLSFAENAMHPTVSFLGTEFQGLRIGRTQLRPVLNHGIFDGDGSDKPPTSSLLESEGFRERAHKQFASLKEFFKSEDSEAASDDTGTQAQGNADINIDNGSSERGSVRCSVVDKIEAEEGSLPGTQAGHAIEITNFGRIFLAELVVGSNSFDLTMLRVELGCPVSGTVSAGQASASASASNLIATAKKHGSGGGTGP